MIPDTFSGSALRSRVHAWKGDSHQIWRTQRVQVNEASLRLFLRSSTGPNRAFEPQSLGRVRDPASIAEGPTAIDAATHRRHFGFRLRLVDKLQPIGGARQSPRREDGKRRVFALHTAQTRPRSENGNSCTCTWEECPRTLKSPPRCGSTGSQCPSPGHDARARMAPYAVNPFSEARNKS